MDGPEKSCGGLVVARGNGAVLFETREEVLDQVTGLIKLLVVFALVLAVFLRWNDDLFSRFTSGSENTIFSIVAPVRQDRFGFKCWQKHVRSIQITRLSGHQAEACRITQGIDSSVDFRA